MREKLKNHIGHNIVCVSYGDNYYEPDDICIECEDCNEVLISTQTYEEEQKSQKKDNTQINIIKNLIEAMCNYGLEFAWTDNEVIESLVECGIEQQDFNDCGFENFVKEYFEDNKEKED
jgi:hypothetical protein